MEKINENTPYKLVNENNEFAPIKKAFFYLDENDRSFDDFTVGEALAQTGYTGEKRIKRIVGYVNDVLEKKNFYQFDKNRPFVGVFDYSIPNPKGTMIIAPGGGYFHVCCNEEGFDTATEANKNGYSAFIVKYGVYPHAKFPEAQDDLANAIKFIYDKKNGFSVTENYDVIGFSASGHLVGLYGSKKYGYLHYGLKKPSHLIVAYPVVTMGEHTHEGTRDNLTNHSNDEHLLKEISVENNIDGDYPPTFVCRGIDDFVVPTINSDILVDTLKKYGVRHEYLIVPDTHHGYAMAYEASNYKWFHKVIEFIEK